MELLTCAPSLQQCHRYTTRLTPRTNLLERTWSETKLAKGKPKRKSLIVASLTEKPSVGFVGGERKKSLQDDADEELLKVVWESLQYDAGYLGAVPNGPPFELETDYVTETLRAARVYDVAIQSPLFEMKLLSESIGNGNTIFLKREDQQQVFSFKLRGAYNMMDKLPDDQRANGVICASAGNHAQGVALSAFTLGIYAKIVMPESTPQIKRDAVERFGGEFVEIVIKGKDFDESQEYAKQLAEEENRTIIPAFDHPDIIAGQGTVGMEIFQQARSPLHAVFVPVGGGGLVSGVAAYMKSIAPEVKIIGVEPNDENSMALAIHNGQRVELTNIGNFADGVAVKVVGEETFRVSWNYIDGVVLVNSDAISAAIKDMYDETRSILEPSGAVALAGAEAYLKYYDIKDESVVAIASGANMDFSKLGTIAQNAQVGKKREAILATFMPEKPGSFKKFCELVGSRPITEFSYRYDDQRKEALVLYSIGIRSPSEVSEVEERLKSSKLITINLTENSLVKDHFRYLMGGRSNVQDELLFKFAFPERVGALKQFLDAFSPRWNISLFRYRSEGDLYGNVLVGFHASGSEKEELLKTAKQLGYPFSDVSPDEAFSSLLR